MKTLALVIVLSSCILASESTRASGADQPTPIVIPMGETLAQQQAADASVVPIPSGVPAPYACTLPQEDIRQRVFLALSFAKQGSNAKAQHVLQLLLNDL